MSDSIGGRVGRNGILLLIFSFVFILLGVIYCTELQWPYEVASAAWTYGKPRDPAGIDVLTVSQVKDTRLGSRNRAPRNPRLVIWSRVPKTASESLLKTLIDLPGRTFNLFLPDQYKQKRPKDENEELEWTQKLMKLPPHSLFEKHLYYLPIERHGWTIGEDFTYITIIRDPVDRIASSYYFRQRIGPAWYFGAEYKGTLDECIVEKCPAVFEIVDQEYANWMTEWFCGIDEVCSQRNDRALARAKENLDHFSVIGLVEDLNGTFRLLEQRLPSYFTGLTEYFFKRNLHIHGTAKSWPKPNNRTIAFLRETNAKDIELYDWVLEHHRRSVKELEEEWVEEPPKDRNTSGGKDSPLTLCFNLEAKCPGPIERIRDVQKG